MLDLELELADDGSLVPMHLCKFYRAIVEQYARDTFSLEPMPAPVAFPKTRDLPD